MKQLEISLKYGLKLVAYTLTMDNQTTKKRRLTSCSIAHEVFLWSNLPRFSTFARGSSAPVHSRHSIEKVTKSANDLIFFKMKIIAKVELDQ